MVRTCADGRYGISGSIAHVCENAVLTVIVALLTIRFTIGCNSLASSFRCHILILLLLVSWYYLYCLRKYAC